MFHRQISEQNYRLRRYFPNELFTGFIEQFWLVDWKLDGDKTHTQQNLPDPNFHLVISREQVKLIGPVSKVFSYTMEGEGRIIGVKFEVGAIQKWLPKPLAHYVDSALSVEAIGGSDFTARLAALYHEQDDSHIVSELEACFGFLIQPLSEQHRTAQMLLTLIRNNDEICRVSSLAMHANMSVRDIQRYFATYVGLTPKWLIRKYRLSRALALLEHNATTILDVVAMLDYTDQSHLIRDFREILGLTPSRYVKFI